MAWFTPADAEASRTLESIHNCAIHTALFKAVGYIIYARFVYFNMPHKIGLNHRVVLRASPILIVHKSYQLHVPRAITFLAFTDQRDRHDD